MRFEENGVQYNPVAWSNVGPFRYHAIDSLLKLERGGHSRLAKAGQPPLF
jgi:hypothetical protein